MARKVKCHVTGESGTNEIFVKIDGHWYKSRDIYEQDKLNKETFNKVKNLIFFELLGMKSGDKYPSFLTKMLREYVNYSNVVLLRILENNKDYIRRYIETHDFNSDYNKLRFISAIISNHVNQEQKRYDREQTEKKKLKEVSESEVMNIATMNDSLTSPPKQEVHDISHWL